MDSFSWPDIRNQSFWCVAFVCVCAFNFSRATLFCSLMCIAVKLVETCCWTLNAFEMLAFNRTSVHISIVDDDRFIWQLLMVGGVVLVAGFESLSWCGAMATSLVLEVCHDRLLTLFPLADHAHTFFQRLMTLVAALLLFGAGILQWGYYATLPEEVHQPWASHSTSFLRYAFTLWAIRAAARAVCAVINCFLHHVGFRWISALARHCITSVGSLHDSVFDPTSRVHELTMRYAQSQAMLIGAWIYSPRLMSLPSQVLFIATLCVWYIRMEALNQYHSVLRTFEDVTAEEGATCGVCLEDFLRGERVKELPCGHRFHGSCIRSWVLRSPSCPNCRQPTNTQSSVGNSHLRSSIQTVVTEVYVDNVRHSNAMVRGAEPRTVAAPLPRNRVVPTSMFAAPLHAVSSSNHESDSSTLFQHTEVMLHQLDMQLEVATQRREESLRQLVMVDLFEDNPFDQSMEQSVHSHRRNRGDDDIPMPPRLRRRTE